MTPLVLKVGGAAYTGWKGIQVRTGIKQLAGQFNLNCADRWAIAAQKRPILRGSIASIEIAGQPVITGRLDDVQPAFDLESHSLAMVGRDATGDLVDCAAEVDGQGWEGRTLEQVAIQLCKPFGINVIVDGATGAGFKRNIFDKTGKISARNPFRTARINPGEKIADAISRAAQLRGYIPVSDGLGNLRLTRAGAGGKAKTVLKHPGNVLGGRYSASLADRFHTYKVYGQQNQAFGAFGGQAEQLLAEATDKQIRAARMTAITTCEDVDGTSSQALADWAAANALGRSITAEVQVGTWLDGDQPWRHNTLIEAYIPWLELDGEYLIADVGFGLDMKGGELAILGLTVPAAYVPAPAHEVDEAAE